MDRRTVWAILLMMVIAIAPALFLKKPAARAGGRGGQPRRRRAGPVDSLAAGAGRPSAAADTARPAADSTAAGSGRRLRRSAEDTVRVTSPLYTYGISTRGARLVAGRAPALPLDGAGREAPAAPRSSRRAATCSADAGARAGHDLTSDQATFTPSADDLAVSGPDAAPAQRGAGRRAAGAHLHLRARTTTGCDVSGRVTGVGPNGGALLVGLGPTLANTEAELEENHRDLALVTKRRRHRADRSRRA